MYILFRFSAEKLRKIGKKYNRSAYGGEEDVVLSLTQDGRHMTGFAQVDLL